MKLAVSAQSFHGQNFATVGVDGQKRTGAHRLAVEQQRASAADLNIATELRAGQTELLAHEIEQGQPGLHLRAPHQTVHFK